MAITALATANTTIGPSQYADMTQALAPRFLVDSPTDLQTHYSGGVVTVQAGAALMAGTRVRVTGSESIGIPAVSFGTKAYAVVMRVDWSKGADDAAQLAVISGTSTIPVNNTNSPNLDQINRIPGVVYDAVLAVVVRRGGSTAAVSFTDYRAWGGDGGPLRVTAGALEDPRYFDMRAGTFISTERSAFTKRLDNDGVWRDVGTASNPWKLWTPTLRFNGTTPPNGVSGGDPVALGTQGTYSGRYRVVDGMLDGFVQITTGTGNQFGTGPITMDVPVPCANWQSDTWSNGHIYTDTSNGGDQNLDWPSQALIKAGWTRALLFTPPSGDYSNLQAHASSTDGLAGSGIPHIWGGYSVGSVYTYNISYPVD